MSASEHGNLAQQLANARGSQQRIDVKLFDAIASQEEAYKLQSMAIDVYPSRQVGWKVGATNEIAQKSFNCDAPFYGPMFEREVMQPSAELPLHDGVQGGEAEFAFVCGSDFPTDKKLSVDELPALIKSCHIAVEIAGRRTFGEGQQSLNSVIADFGGHLAFIPGPALDNWDSMDLAAVEVNAHTNGEETNSGTGAAPLGHPLNSLLWLHNELVKNGGGLKAGDWVSTGTCLGMILPVAGVVDIEFKGCGNISYKFS